MAAGPYILHDRKFWLGRQPVGPVEVDWNNPISNQLALATIRGEPIDLATGYASAGLAASQFNIGSQGRAFSTTGSTQYQAFAVPTPPSQGWTYVTHIEFTSTLNPGAIATYAQTPGSGTQDRGMYTGGASVKLSANFYDGSNHHPAGTTTLVTGTPYVAGISQSSTTGKIYLNGFLEATQGSLLNSGFTGYTGTPDLVLGYGGFGAADSSANIMYAFYMWFRVLADEEQLALAQNPYQLLRPKVYRRILLGPPAGVVSTAVPLPQQFYMLP